MKNGYKKTSLGILPENWDVVQINEVLTIGSGKDYKHLEEGNIPVYGTGGYMTSVNDYLYDGESVGIGRKGTIDRPVLLNGKFWTVDTLFYTYSFKEVIPYYIYVVFQSINWKRYNEATGVPSLSKVNIEKIEIPKPPLPEQQKIAEILTTVDEKIDSIDQRIAEIQELKKGLMQQLLTKGIGHTKFKDSPLGEIPESWEVIPFEGNVEILSGFAFDSSKFNDSVGIPLIRIRNILTGSTDTYYDGEYRKEFIINSGDILVGMDGDFHIKKWTGEKALLNQRNLKLFNDGTTDLNIDFFFYLAQPFLLEVHRITAGTTVKHLSTNDFKKAYFKAPPISEQLKIAEILETVENKLQIQQDKKIEYQELKKGLMQQLLTGKMRVKI